MHKSAHILANESAFREKKLPNFINPAVILLDYLALTFYIQQLAMQLNHSKPLEFRPGFMNRMLQALCI